MVIAAKSWTRGRMIEIVEHKKLIHIAWENEIRVDTKAGLLTFTFEDFYAT